MDKAEAIALVSGTGWLARQTPDFRKAFLERVSLRKFQAGTPIYRAGAPPSGMFGLVVGQWSLQVPPSDVMISVQGPGRWAGDAAALRRRPTMISICAITDCRALHLSQPDFDQLVRDPECCRTIAALTAEGLGEAVTVVSNLIQPNGELRVAQRLLTFIGLYGDDRRVFTDVSQADLATMCGLSRQTLNKVLKSFQDAGVIATAYRRLEILDVKALQVIAFRPPV
ncbi:MAG: Crp/Fnr family transcriptional regulator [Phenylobacterium sp.]|uniref:Crp/Fnr family transcriptional regulator n=1 Tax=Phenylobacterium sp. TaxID=1871053 RepID=UPI00301899B8